MTRKKDSTVEEDEKFETANRLVASNGWNDALDLLLDIVHTSKYYDSLPQTHYMIGQCYRVTEQIDSSINSLEKCVSLIIDDGDKNQQIYGSYYLALGIAYQLDGQYSRAMHYFALGLRKDPTNYRIDNSIGLTCRLMGDYETALRAYYHVYDSLIKNALNSLNIVPLSTDPEKGDLQFPKLLDSGRLKPVLTSNIDFSVVCNNIGLTQYLSGNTAGAIVALKDSIDHIPEGAKYDAPQTLLENIVKEAGEYIESLDNRSLNNTFGRIFNKLNPWQNG